MEAEGMSEYHIVSLSGGKDSTAMLLMMHERGMRIDEVVFADTGMDFPQMHDHIARIERTVGMPVTVVRHELGFEHMMLDHVLAKGKRQGERGYGWPRPNARWCTSKLKTDLIAAYFAELRKTRDVVQYVGIAADEAHRVKGERYPLVEWGVTEAEALRYCYERGFDWGGLYGMFNRVSCWCCPLQGIPELRTLRRNFPDLWEKLLEMDERSFNTFRIDYSARQLEERFAAEDRQLTINFEEVA
ncbi:MAG: phosphoadenosine phosphosulfate reductase family protein [Clostridia bacterium]|nr:phosphoadenosine phosphosulfate reductase family protein [Clostridia bacterium]